MLRFTQNEIGDKALQKFYDLVPSTPFFIDGEYSEGFVYHGDLLNNPKLFKGDAITLFGLKGAIAEDSHSQYRKTVAEFNFRSGEQEISLSSLIDNKDVMDVTKFDFGDIKDLTISQITASKDFNDRVSLEFLVADYYSRSGNTINVNYSKSEHGALEAILLPPYFKIEGEIGKYPVKIETDLDIYSRHTGSINVKLSSEITEPLTSQELLGLVNKFRGVTESIAGKYTYT